MFRQGDIFIQRVQTIPEAAIAKPHLVLAEGEVTGHRHHVEGGAAVAELYESGSDFILDVKAEQANVVHEEHGTIALPRGVYRVWRQREYTPKEIRVVRD